MEKVVEERGKKSGEEYTEDVTVDLKGNPVLRSKTARWRATYFIIGMSKLLTDQIDVERRVY